MPSVRRASLAVLLLVLAAPLAARADGVTTSPGGAVAAPPFVVPEAGRMQVAVGHHWPVAVAHERITYLLKYWKDRFDIASEWRGETAYLSGRVWGVKVRATFELTKDQIVARAEDPGSFWRDRITGYVRAKLKKYMHPDYSEP